MFRKLLKYDCKAIWKIFAICAATSLFFSGVCGILLRKMITGFGDLFAEEADAVATGVTNIIAGEILMILAILSFYGVILAASVFTIFLLYRFYADLFTDIGYLTFTLPVSRRTLLNEKITHYLLWSLAIGGVIACGIKIITLFTPSLPADALAELEGVMATVLSYLGACTWLFGFEGVVIYLLMTVLTALIAFFCITVGSVVAKKHKLLVSDESQHLPCHMDDVLPHHRSDGDNVVQPGELFTYEFSVFLTCSHMMLAFPDHSPVGTNY